MVLFTQFNWVFITLEVFFAMIDALLLADLTTDLTPAIRFQRLVYALKEIFNCGAVVLLKKEAEQLRPIALEGLVKEALGRRFKVAEHPRLTTILASREPIIFDPNSQVPDPYDGLLDALVGEPLPVHDCMGVSLYVEGVLWGALTLDSLNAGTFTCESALVLKRYALLAETFIRVTQLEQERLGWRSLSLEARGLPLVSESSEIIAQSEAITQLLHELKLVAQSDLPLLLLGETGVGKELFARFIHQHSQRSSKPMLHINCAALPESLAESELFGHVKGAFSGATQDRPGRFEAADGGTLFLDEVGELPLSVQAKLLRVLQSGEIQRLGSDRDHHVDVRIIAATNRDLASAVREGRFRADLYHRLGAYPLRVPPLRERERDVLLLAGYFLEQNRTRLQVRGASLSEDAQQALLAHTWPGNVRELEHLLGRALLRVGHRERANARLLQLTAADLGLASDIPAAVLDLVENQTLPTCGLREAVDQYQRQLIAALLQRHHGNLSATARALQIDRGNLHRLTRRLGLSSPPRPDRQGRTPG